MGATNVASPAVAPADGRGAAERPVARRPSAAALAVAALTVLGAAVRVIVAHQSVFADELSTYWISATHSLGGEHRLVGDRKSTRLNSSHANISYAVFCLKKNISVYMKLL